MTTAQIIGIAAVLCVAGMAQSAIGFGYALFATPILLWIGLPLPQTIALVATCSLIQALVGARRLRAEIPWRMVATGTGVRLVFLLLGMFILGKLARLDMAQVRLVVGLILCALVILQFAAKVRPRPSIHWAWGGLAFSSSGVLAGITGMGGPPLVLWVLAHDWSATRTRGFLFAVFALAIPPQIALMYGKFGSDILRAAGMAVLLSPVLLVGIAAGLAIGNRLPKPLLHRIMLLVLLAIGISAVVPPVVAMLR